MQSSKRQYLRGWPALVVTVFALTVPANGQVPAKLPEEITRDLDRRERLMEAVIEGAWEVEEAHLQQMVELADLIVQFREERQR